MANEVEISGHSGVRERQVRVDVQFTAMVPVRDNADWRDELSHQLQLELAEFCHHTLSEEDLHIEEDWIEVSEDTLIEERRLVHDLFRENMKRPESLAFFASLIDPAVPESTEDTGTAPDVVRRSPMVERTNVLH